jgi:hypothetical protein
VTARSNETPKKILSGQQAFEQIILITERNLAKKLRNSEVLERWLKMKSLNSTREEWLGAWKRFQEKQGLDSLSGMHAGVQQTLEPAKAFVLALLRHASDPERTLKSQAAIIHGAAGEGDVEFFKQLGLLLRNHPRMKREGSFLSYSILCYWFAGRLWLMGDKVGSRALSAYTGSTVTSDAYRKTRSRGLSLDGYRRYVKSAPIVGFDPERKSYQYRCNWP